MQLIWRSGGNPYSSRSKVTASYTKGLRFEPLTQVYPQSLETSVQTVSVIYAVTTSFNMFHQSPYHSTLYSRNRRRQTVSTTSFYGKLSCAARLAKCWPVILIAFPQFVSWARLTSDNYYPDTHTHKVTCLLAEYNRIMGTPQQVSIWKIANTSDFFNTCYI